MLEGVLDKFIDELNEHLEPIKDEMLGLERLSFLFLVIGVFGTLVVGSLLGMMVSEYAFVTIVVLYLITLALVYYRNHL